MGGFSQEIPKVTCAKCGLEVDKEFKWTGEVQRGILGKFAYHCMKCNAYVCLFCLLEYYYKDQPAVVLPAKQILANPFEDRLVKLSWDVQEKAIMEQAPCPACGAEAVGIDIKF